MAIVVFHRVISSSDDGFSGASAIGCIDLGSLLVGD